MMYQIILEACKSTSENHIWCLILVGWLQKFQNVKIGDFHLQFDKTMQDFRKKHTENNACCETQSGDTPTSYFIENSEFLESFFGSYFQKIFKYRFCSTNI